MERKISDEERTYDEQLDHLVDVWNLTYAEARERLGEPPYELEETIALSALAAVRGVARRDVDELNIDDPLYFRQYPPLHSSEQASINARGRALVHRVMSTPS